MGAQLFPEKPERITAEMVTTMFNRLQATVNSGARHLASLEGEMARFAEAWREWREHEARKKGGE